MSVQIPRIQVESRPRIGSRYAARLRHQGLLPGVIYGHKKAPIHVALNRKELTDLLHRNTHVMEVALGAETQPCLVKDVQWDHLGQFILHVDLARVDLNERVTVEVALQFVGEAAGLKEEGAIFEHPITSIEVECLATQIPEKIKADISHLKVDDVLTIKDLKLPEGVTTKMDPETIVASISIVREEVVAEVPAEGAATEPEVIGRKPSEEEAAAAAEGAAAPKAAAEKKPAAEKK